MGTNRLPLRDVNRHDKAGMALGKEECGAHILNQALVGDPAVILQQGALEAEPTEGRQADAKRRQ